MLHLENFKKSDWCASLSFRWNHALKEELWLPRSISHSAGQDRKPAVEATRPIPACLGTGKITTSFLKRKIGGKC